MASFTSHSVCLFCYKSSTTLSSNNKVKNETDTLVNKFFRSLERFLNSTSSPKAEPVTNLMSMCSGVLNSCQSCLEILDRFCADYHKLKCVEMELEWKLERLVNVMKVAGRVPSRVKRLNERFASAASIKRESANDSENTINHSSAADFKRCRQKVIKRCTGRISKSQPRVSLKRNAAYEPDCLRVPAVSRLMDDLRPPPEMNSSFSNPGLPTSSFLVASSNGIESVLTGSMMGQAFVRVDIPTKLENQSLALCDESSPTHSPSFVDIQISDPSCDNGEGDFQVGMNSSTMDTDAILVKTEDGESIAESQEPEDQLLQLRCSKCGYTCSKKHDLDTHMTIHSKITSLICPFCDSTFPNNRCLTLHVRREHIEKGDVGTCKLTQCPHCDKKYIEKMALRQHINSVHKAPTQTIKCPECDRSFRKMSQLKQHASIHKGTRTWKFRCTKCDYGCNEKGRLGSHMMAHEKGNILKCELCAKEFLSRHGLTQHIRKDHIDKGDVGSNTVYSCYECDTKYISKKSMLAHMKTAHPGRRFECAECGRDFATNSGLRSHVITHTDPSTWKFPCPECGKRFYNSTDVSRHLVAFHNQSQQQQAS